MGSGCCGGSSKDTKTTQIAKPETKNADSANKGTCSSTQGEKKGGCCG